MKRKLLTTIVIATLSIGMLAGCGTSAPAPAPAAPANEEVAAPAEAENTEAEVTAEEETVENPEYTFYMVRHGQTMFNVRGVCQGWSDSPLTEEGIAMPKKLHDSFKDIPFDACYT